MKIKFQLLNNPCFKYYIFAGKIFETFILINQF